MTQGIHNFKRKLSNKIPLEVTSAISDCPHEDSQNCWHLNVLYHLTILCFHSKCKKVLHFCRNMQKAKTDIEQVWFLFSPPHLFRLLSSSSFSFLFSVKLEFFNIHWKCWYSMETNKHVRSVLFCLLSLAGEKLHTYMIRLCRCVDFDLVTPLTMLIERKWFLTIVPNIGPSSSSTWRK